MLIGFIVGGLAAGLAGATQVVGRPPTWALFADLGNVMNLGFYGIAVALIGRNHPIGGIFAAIFFGGLWHGGRFMEYQVGVCSELVTAIQGIIVIALAVPEFLVVIRRRRPE
jgi:simple sugar transport system permease protein